MGCQHVDFWVIPPEWEVTTLGLLCESGRPISYGIVQTGPTVQNGVPCLRVVDISEGRIDSANLIRTSKAISDAYGRTILCEGDLVAPLRGKVGDVAFVHHELAGANLTRGVALIAVRSSHDAKYVQHALSSPAARARLQRVMNGSALQEIPIAELREFRIALPRSRKEQVTIATALSDADALIESLEQLIAKKRQIKQGAMQELLTGKRRLPGFGGVWGVATIGDLLEVSGGLSASRDQLSPVGIPYLHYGDIHTSQKSFVDVAAEGAVIPRLEVPLAKVSRGALLSDGDVVFVDASEDDEGTSKHVVIINPDRTPFISGLHTIVAKAKDNRLVREYRRFCFQTRDVKAQFKFFAVGTKVSGVSKSNIVKIAIQLPGAEEQTAIADILLGMENELVALEIRLSKARALKQGMMQELLTGRIRLV